MLYAEAERWLASFESRYPQLFTRLRESGWSPGVTSPHRPKWATMSHLFQYNNLALAIEIELGGYEIHTSSPTGGKRIWQFTPGQAFRNLKAAAIDYYDDIYDIIGSEDVFPVGEGHGLVLFVSATGCSALIDQSLCGYLRADNPFVLLEQLLMGIDHRNVIDSEVVAQGIRVTGRPNT